MLPNKFLAVSLVALLAIGGIAGTAVSQNVLEQETFNLIIDKIEYGNPRIAGLAAHINITVKNVGQREFVNTQGWGIFVGLNGETQDHCIQQAANSNVRGPLGSDPCWIRFEPTDNTRIPGNGGTLTVRMSAPWVAPYSLSYLSNTIFAEITGYRSQPTSESAAGGAGTCSGPESRQELCRDNKYREHRVEVKRIGVRAIPMRAAAGADKDLNEPWRMVDVRQTNVCPIAPVNLSRGCYAEAGQSFLALYEVHNVGNVTETYTAELDVTQAFRDRNFIVDFSPLNVTLTPNEKQAVRVLITVHENDTAGRTLNMESATERIRWKSQRAPWLATDNRNDVPGCDDPAFSTYCVNPTLPSMITASRVSFNVTANFTNVNDVPPAGTATFLLNITNNGNTEDFYNVSFDPERRTIDDSWELRVIPPPSTPKTASEQPPPGRLLPGERGTFRVTAKVPPGTLNTSYHFDVHVRSVRDETLTVNTLNGTCKSNEVRGRGTCSVRLTVHVAQSYLLEGIEQGSVRVVPAEPVTFNLGVRNGGNGYDNVTIDLGQSVGGWNPQLSTRTLALTPFNTTTFTLTVTSPPNTRPDMEATFYANITSTGPRETPVDQRSKVSIPSRISIRTGPNLRIDAPVNSTFVDAGAAAHFDLTITNVGNVVDSFDLPPPDRPADWGIDYTRGPFELQPNQETKVRVTLTAPQSATVGERATALVRVNSTVDRFLEKQIALEARVSGPDLFVDNVAPSSTSAYSGDLLNVTVVLGNSGNRPAESNTTLRVYFVQGGVERVIGERTYPAFSLPGQRRLTETFEWDTSGIEGEGVLLARIDVDDSVREIDDSAASNERTRPLVLRTFDIRLRPAEGLVARPGERISYESEPHVFVLQYSGNQPSEPVTIRLESENGWLDGQAELSLALPRGTPLPVIAHLNVPSLPGVATDKLTVTVIPTLRPNEALVASATTTILDEEKPIVRSIRASPVSAALGTPVKITVEAEDATGLSAVTAYITSPTNETSSLVLFRESATTWSANRTFTVAGAYRVSAELIDAATPANRNATRETLGSFTITPGSAPTIRLAAGQSTTVRTGSHVALDIRDPLGIGKASYSIRGVSYELRGPEYRIDTSTFAAGLVEIAVTAENIYGVATTERFNLTVDNTIPSITRVTMSPERPRANEAVTITVQTEAKVEAVDVLVKRDGQVVQTLNGTRRGVGSFVVSFTPPEGSYSLDVTARDAAGNSRLAERAVVFSAKPDSPFDVPGPGALLVGLALAGVALLLRRRRG